MMSRAAIVFRSCFKNLALLPVFLIGSIASSHPMDFGTLEIQARDTQLKISFRIHDEAIQSPADGTSDRVAYLLSEIRKNSPFYKGSECQLDAGEMSRSQANLNFWDINFYGFCGVPKYSDFRFEWPLQPIQNFRETFKLEVQAIDEMTSRKYHQIVTHNEHHVILGTDDPFSSYTFFNLGRAHIGAKLSEWTSSKHELKVPEGIDHIAFVIVLTLANLNALRSLVLAITGFTIGHSLTIFLSMFNMIHIHSHWVEAVIALSIAWVSLTGLMVLKRSHSQIVTILFGAIHGLGFSSALQDMGLPKEQLIPAIIEFSAGIEFGQLLFVGVVLITVRTISQINARLATQVQKMCLVVIGVLGFVGFVIRAID